MGIRTAGKPPNLAATAAHWLRSGVGFPAGALLLACAASMLLWFTAATLKERLGEAQVELADALGQLDQARGNLTLSETLLRQAERLPVASNTRPYLVISLAERRLWYRLDNQVLENVPVATGSGKTLVKEGGASVWRFETPRGRFTVVGKEEHPLWVPPDWHYIGRARQHNLGLVRLERGKPLPLADGSQVKVVGLDVVREYPGGRRQILKASEKHDIVADGRIVIPPLDTNQRHIPKVLGSHRLLLGQGYGLHGTNNPASVGRAVSHGCVRLRNEDIARLYRQVPVGTPVYLY
jgi:hypothetical protein